MASKGPLLESLPERAVRSWVEAPRRSVAEGAPEALDWIWEAEYSLAPNIHVSNEGVDENGYYSVRRKKELLEEGEREQLPLNSYGKLPGAGARLDDNVGFLDAGLEQLGLCAGDEGLDDGHVPARVDDADAQAGAVVVLRSGALDGRHDAERASERVSE